MIQNPADPARRSFHAIAWLSPAARRFGGALSWTLAAHALVRGAVVLAGLGVIRTLGVDAFADFTFYLFSINLLAAFSDMGISYAVLKFGVVARLKSDPRSIDRLAATLQMGLASSVLAFAAILLFTRVSSWPAWQVGALGFAGPAVVWQVIFSAVLLSMRRPREVFAGNAIFAAILLTGAAASVLRVSQMPLMVSFPLGALAQCVYQATLINRLLEIRWIAWLRPRFKEMQNILGMVGYMAPTSLIASTLPWLIANIQLTHGIGKTSLAVFGAATLIFGFTMIIPGRVAQLFFIEQIEQNISGGRMHQFLIADLKAAAASVGAATVVVTVLYAIGGIFIGKFSAEIAGYSAPIFALSAVALVVCPYQIVGNRIVASGWPQLWLPLTILQAIALLAVMWVDLATPEWNPALAYWGSYVIALLWAIPVYVFAIRRARA